MNRIKHATKPVKEACSGSGFDIAPSFLALPAHDSSCALFTPLHYEPNYAYPLIVWLHAPGKDGEHQLMQVMPAISLRNYVAVAPRGFYSGEGKGQIEELDWPQTPDRIHQSGCRVFEGIEAVCRRRNVAKDRVFLAGVDAGGTMAFRVAMNHPSRFVGVLSICGPFPRGYHPFGQLTLARKLPVFLAVGRDSRRYSPTDACRDLRLFHTAGVSVALRQYPCGHELTQQMLRDVDRWIIEQITAGSQPPADEPGMHRPCSSD